jgi:tetratricopeptide (TPR) repeat protein
MLLLGLYLPFIFARQTRGIWLLLIFSGVLVATASNIRAENLPVLASCVMVVAFLSSFSMLRRFMMVVVILFIYYLTNQGIRSYFDMKFEEAVEVVESAGGHPYYGGRIESHRFWHPVFCGLGDFDKKYGYEWNDIVAYNYAIPILERDYGLTLNYSGDKYYLDEYYDEAKHYYKKFDEIDEYEEVMKQKVMGDIKSDPGWYIDILFKRVNRILTNTAPIHAHFTLKGMGWLLLPLLLILIWVKEWRFVQLVVFALPLVASSILIYSGGNSTYSSPYHFVLLGLLLTMLIEFLLLLKAKPNPKAPME